MNTSPDSDNLENNLEYDEEDEDIINKYVINSSTISNLEAERKVLEERMRNLKKYVVNNPEYYQKNKEFINDIFEVSAKFIKIYNTINFIECQENPIDLNCIEISEAEDEYNNAIDIIIEIHKENAKKLINVTKEAMKIEMNKDSANIMNTLASSLRMYIYIQNETLLTYQPSLISDKDLSTNQKIIEEYNDYVDKLNKEIFPELYQEELAKESDEKTKVNRYIR
jgi:hypothetical protein